LAKPAAPLSPDPLLHIRIPSFKFQAPPFPCLIPPVDARFCSPRPSLPTECEIYSSPPFTRVFTETFQASFPGLRFSSSSFMMHPDRIDPPPFSPGLFLSFLIFPESLGNPCWTLLQATFTRDVRCVRLMLARSCCAAILPSPIGRFSLFFFFLFFDAGRISVPSFSFLWQPFASNRPCGL